MFGYILEKITLSAVLSDQIAIIPFSDNRLQSQDVRVAHFPEYLYLILKHLKTRVGVLADVDNFQSVLGVVFDAAAFVNLTSITCSNLILFAIDVITYFLCVLC